MRKVLKSMLSIRPLRTPLRGMSISAPEGDSFIDSAFLSSVLGSQTAGEAVHAINENFEKARTESDLRFALFHLTTFEASQLQGVAGASAAASRLLDSTSLERLCSGETAESALLFVVTAWAKLAKSVDLPSAELRNFVAARCESADFDKLTPLELQALLFRLGELFLREPNRLSVVVARMEPALARFAAKANGNELREMASFVSLAGLTCPKLREALGCRAAELTGVLGPSDLISLTASLWRLGFFDAKLLNSALAAAGPRAARLLEAEPRLDETDPADLAVEGKIDLLEIAVRRIHENLPVISAIFEDFFESHKEEVLRPYLLVRLWLFLGVEKLQQPKFDARPLTEHLERLTINSPSSTASFSTEDLFLMIVCASRLLTTSPSFVELLFDKVRRNLKDLKIEQVIELLLALTPNKNITPSCATAVHDHLVGRKETFPAASAKKLENLFKNFPEDFKDSPLHKQIEQPKQEENA